MKHWMREALVWAVRHQPASLQAVGGVNVRVAAAKDMKAVHEMIVELAVFEKEPEVSRAVPTTLSSFLCSFTFDHRRVFGQAVKTTAATLRRDGFGPWYAISDCTHVAAAAAAVLDAAQQAEHTHTHTCCVDCVATTTYRPLFWCLIAETADRKPAAFALVHTAYSTWEGVCVYLEVLTAPRATTVYTGVAYRALPFVHFVLLLAAGLVRAPKLSWQRHWAASRDSGSDGGSAWWLCSCDMASARLVSMRATHCYDNARSVTHAILVMHCRNTKAIRVYEKLGATVRVASRCLYCFSSFC